MDHASEQSKNGDVYNPQNEPASAVLLFKC